MQMVKKFDKESVSHATVRKLAKFMKDPQFTPENVIQVSVFGAYLCQWVRLVALYADEVRGPEGSGGDIVFSRAELEQFRRFAALRKPLSAPPRRATPNLARRVAHVDISQFKASQ